MTVQRVLRGVSATIEVTTTDQNGTAADAAGPVTIGVTRADGTVLVAAGAATTKPAGTVGIYRYTLTAANTALLDRLTATWTDAVDSSAHTTYVEIAGGYYFSLAEARASDESLQEQQRYPDTLVLDVRREVEHEFEGICGAAFVPRYERARVDGLGSHELILPDPFVRAVRSVRVYSTSSSYTAYTAAELADVDVADSGIIARRDGTAFPAGRGNIVVEYEHGMDAPPHDVKRAGLTRLRSRLASQRSGIPDRATSFTAGDGGTYRLARESATSTGIDAVDAVLDRHDYRAGVII